MKVFDAFFKKQFFAPLGLAWISCLPGQRAWLFGVRLGERKFLAGVDEVGVTD